MEEIGPDVGFCLMEEIGPDVGFCLMEGASTA
jgi:hypothetical protein